MNLGQPARVGRRFFSVVFFIFFCFNMCEHGIVNMDLAFDQLESRENIITCEDIDVEYQSQTDHLAAEMKEDTRQCQDCANSVVPFSAGVAFTMKNISLVLKTLVSTQST